MRTKNVLTIAAVISAIIILIIIFNDAIASQLKGLVILLASFISVTLLVMLMFKFSDSMTFKGSTVKTKTLGGKIEEINDSLKADYSDEFVWEGGRNMRVDTKRFSKIKYFAVLGPTMSANSALAIFNTEEKDIERFIYDPDAYHIADLFYDFNPVHKDQISIMSDYYGYKKRKPTFTIPAQQAIIQNPPEQRGGDDDDSSGDQSN